MQATSHWSEYTGDDQGGSGGQRADGATNPPSLLPDQRRSLLDHHDLGVQQLQARFRLRRGEVGLPESLHLQHWVATREERPRHEKGGNDANRESYLEDDPIRDSGLCGGAESHQHTSKTQDDASLAIETLGMRVHRLSLCRDLREHDRQRRKLLILLHSAEGTR